MRKLLIVLGLLLGCGGLARASTYYVANGSGVTCSDANSSATAQSKTTPWCNAPGMAAASGAAASFTPAAGDNIVLRGCDTWTFSGTAPAGQWNIKSSGSSGNLISYGGLDQTWYNTSVCPSAWNRPIISGGGSWPGTGNASAFETNGKSYLNVEWLEITGLFYSGAQATAIDLNTGTNINVFDNYIHGWQAGTLNLSSEFFGIFRQVANPGDQVQVYLNIVDGSDSITKSSQGSTSSCEICVYLDGPLPGGAVYENYMTQSNGCFINGPQSFHDNTLVNCGLEPASGTGQHNNMFESNTDRSGMTYYNNFTIHGNTGNAAYTTQNQMAPETGQTSYAFNNVIVDSNPNASHNMMCEKALSSPGGTCEWFNNTVEGGADTAGNDANGGGTAGAGSPPHFSGGEVSYGNAILINNHFITSSAAPAYDHSGSGVLTSSTDTVIQSQSIANGQSYSLGQTYPFSPISGCTSSTCSTVQAGANETSLCTTIGGFDSAAGTACQNDTTLGVSYNSTNHTLSFPARTTNARPGTGTWDVGAYQLVTSGSATTPSCSPGTGNYASSQTVTCTNPNSGTTVMCFTTNGTTPATNGAGTGCTTGTQYTTTITVSSPETLQVIAGTSTLSDSSVASYSYTFTIATPTFSPPAGHYTTSQTVTITAQSGATICYTTNGSNPTAPTAGTCTNGTAISSGSTITVSGSRTVKALGTQSGLTNSSIATAVYVIGGLGYLSGGCSIQAQGSSSSNSWTFSCTPSAANDAVLFDVYCHPNSGTITAVSLTASGWSLSQLVADTSQGSTPPGIAATFGALAPNTSAATFTATFTGASNCSNFDLVLGAEFSGNNTTGGSTTFPASGTSGGASGTCNQTAANVTPTTNNNAVWFACVDSATAPNSPYSAGVTDGGGDLAEYQILSGGSGVAQTPAFAGSTGPYVIEGVAIAPPQGSAPTFSPVGGTYGTTQTVTLTQAQSLAMCYTTNGSTPASNGAGLCSTGTLYSTPISVSTTQTINAIGMASGYNDSPVGSATYTISGSVNPPTGLTVTLTSGNGVLNWTASSTGGVTYSVFRGTNSNACVNGSTAYATGISSTTYTDTSVSPGVNYFYEVDAVSGSTPSSCAGPAELVVPPSYPVWF